MRRPLNDYRRFVVQYLVKPFVENWQEKLRKAIDALMAAKLNDSISISAPPVNKNDSSAGHTFVQNRGNLLRLDFDKIAYLEAAGGGETLVVTDTETQQVDLTLNKFLDLLPSDRFLRISKNNLVNTERIVKINREDRSVEVKCLPKNKSLGVGDTYYTELMKHLPLAKEHGAKKSPPPHPAVLPQEPPVLLEREIASKIQGLQEEKSELVIEKQKSDNLLRNILPEEIAEELKQTGQTTARRYDLVTVLFCDIKDFTRLAEQLPPEELIGEIDCCFRQFDEIASRNGIEKIKTIGDCYMAAGGLPVADEDNPVRTVRAAVEMQRWLLEHRAAQQAAGKLAFEARIGIHTGAVVAGVVGQHKFAYDIWGDAVNIAARIEQAGQVGKINISADTYEHVKRHFACRYGGTIEAKNKGEMEVYFVE
ncbi:MAG: LytTR family transcriptional regulator DNA-binding domain-containing protein [Saprospiraceae bacterium]|nr:LytTR family transcriptional regulator DNA-binding domain-containing protein [Saprospiraceae bacterium]